MKNKHYISKQDAGRHVTSHVHFSSICTRTIIKKKKKNQDSWDREELCLKSNSEISESYSQTSRLSLKKWIWWERSRGTRSVSADLLSVYTGRATYKECACICYCVSCTMATHMLSACIHITYFCLLLWSSKHMRLCVLWYFFSSWRVKPTYCE